VRVRAFAAGLLATVTFSGSVAAQCVSNASSCVRCHETEAQRPVLQLGQPWHVDHGFGDLCVACHAGDPAATTQQQAHLGVHSPLTDPSVSCAGCHIDDAAQRAERYVLAVNARRSVPPASVKPTSSAQVGSTANRVLAAVAVLLTIGLAAMLRRRIAVARQPLSIALSEKLWSPYAAGVLLGVVVAWSEVIYARPVAVSGAFDKLAAYVGRALFSSSQYYRHVMTPGITWQVWVVVGVLLGAFASSSLSAAVRLRWLPDSQWSDRFGTGRIRRLLIAFGGAVLVQLGAGIAGGCSSGLAISGGATLAPGAFVFMAGMFAGGIPTAWFWYRGRRV